MSIHRSPTSPTSTPNTTSTTGSWPRRGPATSSCPPGRRGTARGPPPAVTPAGPDPPSPPAVHHVVATLGQHVQEQEPDRARVGPRPPGGRPRHLCPVPPGLAGVAPGPL